MRDHLDHQFNLDQSRMKERLLMIHHQKCRKDIVKKYLSLWVILLALIRMTHWKNKKCLIFFLFHQKIERHQQQISFTIILWGMYNLR